MLDSTFIFISSLKICKIGIDINLRNYNIHQFIHTNQAIYVFTGKVKMGFNLTEMRGLRILILVGTALSKVIYHNKWIFGQIN